MKLFLDMDDTLLKAEFEKRRTIFFRPDFSVFVHFKKSSEIVNVYKRPGLDEFLTEITKMFDVTIFTASLPLYAIPILRHIDPNRKCKRLYRNDTVPYNGYPHVKNLNLVCSDLKKALIIDDSPIAMSMNPDNAILVRRFTPNFSGTEDRELQDLFAMLKNELYHLEDVRPYMREKYKFKSELEKHLNL